jgi:hypothetical protein
VQEGLGPQRGRAGLVSVTELATERLLFDGKAFLNREPVPLVIDLDETVPINGRIRLEFLTPTELKAHGALVTIPEFEFVMARLRDRISNLSLCYQGGGLKIDFEELNRAARSVRLVSQSLRQVEASRRSSRTGQVHSIGGFVGTVEYDGEWGGCLPFLRAGEWTGVGRQTVWGKGMLRIDIP